MCSSELAKDEMHYNSMIGAYFNEETMYYSYIGVHLVYAQAHAWQLHAINLRAILFRVQLLCQLPQKHQIPVILLWHILCIVIVDSICGSPPDCL